jgi:transposase
MVLIGCDFHPAWQQVCWLDTETGETEEHKLRHQPGEVEKFYRRFAPPARIGIESTGNCQWFLDRMAALGHEVWVGDAAKIRASDVRRQKHDRRDAHVLLELLEKGDKKFPKITVPSSEVKDQRQLLIHRHHLVRMRARIKTELQHLALNQGVQRKGRLWSEAGQKLLRELPLGPWAGRRRADLLELMGGLDGKIAELDRAVLEAAKANADAQLLMTQVGVGPVTSLAFVLTIGDVSRFARGKNVASYLGLIPCEHTSGEHQRLGRISKQGNRFLRMLLVESAQIAVRCDPQFRKEYLHRCHTKPKGVAKVAAARKLAIRLYWMLRNRKQQQTEVVSIESSSRVALTSAS